jgi:hypothetical protein
MGLREPGADTGLRAWWSDDVRVDWRDARIEPSSRSGVQSEAERAALGPAQAKERPMTVFVYVDMSKQGGDKDHIKVFATVDAAETGAK